MPGTRLALSAREIAGWQYQQQHAAALARALDDSRRKIEYLLRVGRFDAQNDALINTG
jgi:hypothetical protein